MSRRVALVCLLLMVILAGSATALAAERAQVMLVLDVSGSMWGRVEGKEKILVAREVVGAILSDWNPDVELGVIAYGHRRKGDCRDIETVVPLGPVDAAAIRATVEGLVPKGKTPLSAAVQQAARELRYTEEKATVILVSDGKETCDADPCAVGAELERTGVDFTAHVIGFDISDEERAQLQCLAEATGGRYFDADRAEALQTALTEAVREVQAQPAQVRAVLSEGSAPLTGVAIDWRAEPAGGGETVTATGDSLALPPGDYTVTATLEPVEVSAGITLDSGGEQTLVLNAGRLDLAATAGGPEGAIAEPRVDWTIQNMPGEFEAATASGPSATLYLPADTYGVFARFESIDQDQVLRLAAGETAEVRFSFEQAGATLTAPDSAAAGSVIEVGWDGPNGKNDYISVAAPDQPANKYENYTYTRHGSPLELLLPDRDGMYELRYVSNETDTVLARRPIEVAPITATLEVPEEAAAGKIIEVIWEGPDNKNDFISVAAPDQPANKYENYTYTRHGSPLELLLPDQPGIYEIRYVSNQSDIVLARRAIVLTELSADLRALDIVPVDQNIRVEWRGPDNKNDYISVATPDQPANKYVRYTRTREGNPLQLRMPDRPGDYELRYVSNQSDIVLARRPVTVVAAEAFRQRIADADPASVTLQALDQITGQPVAEGLSWTLYAVEGPETELLRSDEASPRFELPMGVYRANVRGAGAGASLDFIVNPGETLTQSLMLR